MPRFECSKCGKSHDSKLAFSLSRCLELGVHEIVQFGSRPPTAGSKHHTPAANRVAVDPDIDSPPPMGLGPKRASKRAFHAHVQELREDSTPSSTSPQPAVRKPERPSSAAGAGDAAFFRHAAAVAHDFQVYRDTLKPRPAIKEKFADTVELVEPPSGVAVAAFLEEAKMAIDAVADQGKYSPEIATYIKAKFLEFKMVCELE
jgi:hypothetical protein